MRSQGPSSTLTSQAGSVVNNFNNRGLAPLHLACSTGNAVVARALLNNGAGAARTLSYRSFASCWPAERIRKGETGLGRSGETEPLAWGLDFFLR